MRAAVCVALLLGASWRVVAGETPPEPPLVAAPPAPCAWMVDVAHKRPRQPPPDDPQKAAVFRRIQAGSPRMKRITVEKAGENIHSETLWENGKVDVFWLFDGWMIYRLKDFLPNQVTVLSKDSPLAPLKNVLGSDFPDLAWIRQEAFVKTVNYHGQRCHYYEDKEAPPLSGGDTLNPTASKGVHAWIDVATRHPVAVEDDAMLKTFRFSAKPPARLELVGPFAAAYEKASQKSAAENVVSPEG